MSAELKLVSFCCLVYLVGCGIYTTTDDLSSVATGQLRWPDLRRGATMSLFLVWKRTYKVAHGINYLLHMYLVLQMGSKVPQSSERDIHFICFLSYVPKSLQFRFYSKILFLLLYFNTTFCPNFFFVSSAKMYIFRFSLSFCVHTLQQHKEDEFIGISQGVPTMRRHPVSPPACVCGIDGGWWVGPKISIPFLQWIFCHFALISFVETVHFALQTKNWWDENFVVHP